MSKIDDTTVVRPLARVIARELSNEEVSMVTGGFDPPPPIITTGGNGGDGTTHGKTMSDKDEMQ